MSLVIEVSDEYLKDLNKNSMKTLASIAQGIFLNEEAKTTGKSIDDLIEDYSIDTSKKVVVFKFRNNSIINRNFRL